MKPDRNERMIAFVVGGKTYSETARHFGVTRSAVAGVCWRAGVRVGQREGHFTEEGRAALRAAQLRFHRRRRLNVEKYEAWKSKISKSVKRFYANQ